MIPEIIVLSLGVGIPDVKYRGFKRKGGSLLGYNIITVAREHYVRL